MLLAQYGTWEKKSGQKLSQKKVRVQFVLTLHEQCIRSFTLQEGIDTKIKFHELKHKLSLHLYICSDGL